MATTTTNYGWDIPQSTDLVKDGATAIATLGQDIDTSVYTALGGNKSGMVHLSTVAFSGVASQSLPNDTFTSTYDNYFIYLEITARSTTSSVSVRFRASGTDKTSADYSHVTQLLLSSTGVLTTVNSSTATSIPLDTSTSPTRKHFYAGYITNPNKSEFTTMTLTGTSIITVGSQTFVSSVFNLTDVIDSLSIAASAGNITGLIRIYGVNQ